MLTKQEDFAFVATFEDQIPVTLLIEFTNVSRSGFYRWKNETGKRVRDFKDEDLFHLILEIFQASRGTYGKKRIKAALLRQHGLIVNHKCISRIMRKYGLVCKIRQKRFKRPIQPHGTIKNILNRKFNAQRPGMKFCIDITYVEVKKPIKRWAYVCAVKDLFNNEIVAYTVGPHQGMSLVLDSLNQLKEKGFEKGAILHSDQGFQFTNPTYIKRLERYGLTQSMSRRGNCWDNACIENFFGHLKCEMPFFGSPQTLEEVQTSVSDYMIYYNEERIQNKYGMSPLEYRIHAA
ncbi:IS3 family transposase [Peribacillus acanthi]|uniref:IS3 family transposase n=1 Tax=Peribacillus acanthi TaxID=2171554 RepID=UPI001F0C6332|nr:IS3 family transposase [Peribacillus acanthi]